MLLKQLVASFIFLCATCCPEDDCAAVSCLGPPVLAFNIEQDNANVFITEIYTLEDISVTGDNANDFMIGLSTFNSENTDAILVLENYNWSTGTFQNNLVLENNIIIPLVIEIELSESGGCCGGIPRLKSLEINGILQENNTGLYNITLD